MDAEMPPESPKKGLTPVKFWRAVAIGVALFAVLQLLIPRTTRCGPKAETSRTRSNARQLGMALFEFKEQYGRFPDASTVAAVKAKTGSTWTFGGTTTSNGLLKQLLAAKIAQTEDMFYAKSEGVKKPDNLFAKESEALATGECGFGYIPAASDATITTAPILVAPIIPGTFKFDPIPFDGKAIVLRADNAVLSYQIAPDGHVIAPGGLDLFDPGQPWWMGKPPTVAWPALPPPSPPPGNTAPWIAGAVAIFILLAILIVKLRRKAQSDLILSEPIQ